MGYTVTIILETPFFTMAQKPVAIGVDQATAKSIHRHYERLYRNYWSDRDQTGIYVTMVSREFCTNHTDFETAHHVDLIGRYVNG